MLISQIINKIKAYHSGEKVDEALMEKNPVWNLCLLI